MSGRESVVQFGAGAVGRGFAAQFWSEAGYETVFVDVDAALVEAINRAGAYPLELAGPDRRERLTIAPVRALPAGDRDAVTRAVAVCRFACTAVGVAALPHVAPALAAGLEQREDPLAVILCENALHCARLLRKEVGQRAGAAALDRLRPVESVVGRMIPRPSAERLRREPLLVTAEDYPVLPVDGEAARGCLPAIPGVIPSVPFAASVERKLFLHNMAHAAAAYAGYRAGAASIHQAMGFPNVERLVRSVLREAGAGLCARWGFDPGEIAAEQEQLIRRFRNPDLDDAVTRVARDPARKLGPEERLTGAARLCDEAGVEHPGINRAIALALLYDAPGDPSAARAAAILRDRGPAAALRELTGLDPGSTTGRDALEALEMERARNESPPPCIQLPGTDRSHGA